MSILTDCHLHTAFSADSEAPMEAMIQRGLELGLQTMCFTEHMDHGMLENGLSFEVDTPAYRKHFLEIKEKYRDKIELLFGIELGLEARHAEFLKQYSESFAFDFVIGSSHTVQGKDPYFADFYEGRTEEEAYRIYFETVPENLAAFSNIDTYGHLDYVVRYGPDRNKYYTYERYQDVIDAALGALIEKGIGLEINSAGYKYGLGAANPCMEVVKAYRRMGGEIVTIGSDAHAPEWIADSFGCVRELLLECGFRYYAVFRGRKPYFLRL